MIRYEFSSPSSGYFGDPVKPGARVDATGFTSEEQAREALKDVKEILVNVYGGRMIKRAVIIEPFQVYTNTSNPSGNGWGNPGGHIYAVARYELKEIA